MNVSLSAVIRHLANVRVLGNTEKEMLEEHFCFTSLKSEGAPGLGACGQPMTLSIRRLSPNWQLLVIHPGNGPRILASDDRMSVTSPNVIPICF